MLADLTDVRHAVLAWYAAGHRDLPWRGTTDPYAILVSEVMLQQTQASRVAERFPRFMARFPTADALAKADVADVLAEWSGLGYNRRARALHEAARAIVRDGWPRDVGALERLPGVGPYTARAIASTAFGRRVGVVDTNVRRWLSRRFGISGGSALQEIADRLAQLGSSRDLAEAATWTHATMELGARVCRAAAPGCASCPIAAGCPSRDAAPHVPVPRQAAYRGSPRAYRGTLIQLLAATPGRSLPLTAARTALAALSPRIGPALGDAAFDGVVDALQRDGLLTRLDGELRLGGHRSVQSDA